MRRRSFMGLFGAAVAVPAVPFAAPSAPAAVYSRSAYGLAVMHAKTRPHVTARGIAHCLKLPKSQASAMMAEMVKGGLITPVTVAADGTMRATSNILIKDPWGLARTSAARNATAARAKDQASADHQAHATAKGNPLIAHLCGICRDQGLVLHQRCLAA